MTPRRIALSVAAAAWIGLATWATPLLAGGGFLLANRANPLEASRSTWSQNWAEFSDVRPLRKKLQGAMGFALFISVGLPGIAILASTRTRRSLHGDARWATRNEMRDARLLQDKGIILGKYGGTFMMMDDPKFVLLCAPTRSGKGVGTIIPNLLNWPDSAVVVDIKEETFPVTSGFRARHGQKVFKFAPFADDFASHCWNPLSYVSRDPRFMVGELQSIGYMLYPREDGPTAFFSDQARNLFVAVALYCIETGAPVTIGEVLRRSAGGGRAKEFWQGVVDAGVSPDGVVLSERCLSALRQFVGTSENTFTSILASFNAPLGIFANPIVDAATSRDDFDVRDLRRQRMTVYVVVPPPKLTEAALLVNLFFSVVIDQNTKVLPEADPSLRYRCLLVLDEAPALGRIDKFASSIGYIAGYGLRAITIGQSQSQFQAKQLYGIEGTRTLVANHLIQVMYAPREQADAKEYSDVLGYDTETAVSRGRSGKTGSITRSVNESDQRRALMLPQELREMGDDRIIVLADNCRPVFAEKIRYYQEPVFMARVLPPVTAPSLDVDGHIARVEGCARPVREGELVEPERIVAHEGSRPDVTEGRAIPAEVDAMANWLLSNVDWSAGGPPVAGSDVEASRREEQHA